MSRKHDIEANPSNSLLLMQSFDEIVAQPLEVKPEELETPIEDMGYFQIIRIVMMKALPLFLGSLANISCFTMVFFFISRTTDDQNVLGAIGLGNMTLNLFMRSFILGFNLTLVTMLSQAYGARHLNTMGNLINKYKIMLSVLIIPLMLTMLFIKPMLMMIGQSEDLSTKTSNYATLAMLGFFFQLHFDIYRKLLNAMKLFHIHSFIPYISLISHIFW